MIVSFSINLSKYLYTEAPFELAWSPCSFEGCLFYVKGDKKRNGISIVSLRPNSEVQVSCE